MTRFLSACLLLAACALLGCGSAQRWTAEGDELLRDNQLVAAEKAYNSAIAIDAHYAPALYGKGWALYVSGHDELVPAARQLFRRCIDYAPEYWGGYRGMGVLLLDEDKVTAAEKMLRTAYEKDPTEPTVLLTLGQLYLRASRYDEARELFAGAIAQAPDRGEFLRFMAELEMRQGRHDEARRWIVEGRAKPVGGQRGLMLLDEGELRIELDRARSLLERATGPDDPALNDALQALDVADSLLDKASRDDPRMRSPALRRRYHDRLRQRIREAMGV